MKKTGIAGVILTVLLMLCGATNVWAYEETGQERAMDGIFIENIDVSGKNEEEITEAVQGKIQQLSKCRISLYAGDAGYSVSAEELGLDYTNESVIAQALELGQKGNVLQRFRTKKSIKDNGPLVLKLNYAVQEDTVRTIVEQECTKLNHAAVDMSLKREEDGSFTVVEGRDGATVKTEESVSTILNFFSGQWRGGEAQITLSCDRVEAKGDAGQLSMVQSVLGESSTDYSSSSENRRKNIQTGTEKLNGILLYPGEELSVCDLVTPFDEENGYATAPSYALGTVVETYGGGICQVSTTLYLAVLRAELEVTSRSAHSMMVGYVEPSMDAAIAEGTKDFKFRNNTDAPVYIYGSAQNGKLEFCIYGHEMRDTQNRIVRFESETLSTTEPEKKYSVDETLAFGVQETAVGRTGATAKLWKIVTVNGEETRQQVNTSNYRMTATEIRIGTADGDQEAVNALKAAVQANDEKQIQEVLQKYPGGKAPEADKE